MTREPRKYLGIYFEDGLVNNRKKRDLTIAFKFDDPVYQKCKNMSSSELKELLGIFTYKDLVEKSESEGRTLNNFIKFKLRIKLAL